MRKVLTGTICAIATVSLTACGSSNPNASSNANAPAMPSLSANAKIAATALAQELVKQSATSTSPLKFNSTQAECAASHVVSSVGEAKLQSYGLIDSTYRATDNTLDNVTMSKADATSVVTAFIDCLGESAFTQDLADAVSSSIPGATGASQRACLQNKLTAAALKPMLVSTLSGNQQAATNFYAGLLKCAKS